MLLTPTLFSNLEGYIAAWSNHVALIAPSRKQNIQPLLSVQLRGRNYSSIPSILPSFLTHQRQSSACFEYRWRWELPPQLQSQWAWWWPFFSAALVQFPMTIRAYRDCNTGLWLWLRETVGSQRSTEWISYLETRLKAKLLTLGKEFSPGSKGPSAGFELTLMYSILWDFEFALTAPVKNFG